MTSQRERIAKLVSEYGAESYQGGLPGREHTAYDALMTAIDSLIGDAARAPREPTEAMIQAGIWAPGSGGAIRDNVVAIYRAMLKANGVIEVPEQGENETLTPIDTNDESASSAIDAAIAASGVK